MEERFFAYDGFCLCPRGGKLPAGTAPVEEPFSPLVFLIERDPTTSRGFFAVRTLAELDEHEGPSLLQNAPETEAQGALDRFVRLNGAAALNTAFSRAIMVLADYRARQTRKRYCNIIGLGNVGGTAAIALKLLGGDLRGVGIWDADEAKTLRYEGELNQVLPVRDGEPMPRIEIRSIATLFDCDAVLFTAAKAVPELGAAGDVRMAQYAANRDLLRDYARLARTSGFTGLFAQISDPVDQLSRAVFLMSNQNERGEYDWGGLLPEQVRGFGLGIMRARAVYTAERERIDSARLRAYGPHGSGLIIANAPDEGYDAETSAFLTERAETANLEIRKIGYKPYIAPALSSAAISALRALRGEWHDAAVPLGGVYFGCRGRLTANGPEQAREPLAAPLAERIRESYDRLKGFDAIWAD